MSELAMKNGRRWRKQENNSFFTANNFVNSVLANVIIKIKENYINA